MRLPPEMTPQIEMEFARLHESYREAETVPEQYGLLLTMCLLAYVDDDGRMAKALMQAGYDELLGALGFFMQGLSAGNRQQGSGDGETGQSIDDLDWATVIPMLCDHYTGTLPSQWLRERSYWVDACLERVPAFQGRRRMMGIADMQLSRLPGQEFSTHRAIMAMNEEIRKLQRSQRGRWRYCRCARWRRESI